MFRNYLKMAWKVLGRRRFFTFVSLFGIGFTLTSLMVVVAIADHQLAPSYPETELNRMLILDQMRMFGDRSRWYSGPGFKFLDQYARDLPGVERMTAFTRANGTVTFKDGLKLEFATRGADAEYWRVMDFEFLEGAAFSAEDDVKANRVAVISESARNRLFDQAPALGRTVELDGRDFRIVGVVRDVPWQRMLSSADVWVPIHTVTAANFFDRLMGGCQAAFLLEPGADRRQVQAAFTERLTRVKFEDPERYHTMKGLPKTRLELYSGLLPGLEPEEAAPRRMILLAVLAAFAFMALPAINLVNINLSRIYERSGEIGVRKAFGASGRDLVTQFVVENVFLCLIGGVIGLFGALAILKLAALFPQAPFLSFHLSWRIFLAAVALATVFGLVSGVWPAWKMSRQHPVRALRGGVS